MIKTKYFNLCFLMTCCQQASNFLSSCHLPLPGIAIFPQDPFADISGTQDTSYSNKLFHLSLCKGQGLSGAFHLKIFFLLISNQILDHIPEFLKLYYSQYHTNFELISYKRKRGTDINLICECVLYISQGRVTLKAWPNLLRNIFNHLLFLL